MTPVGLRALVYFLPLLRMYTALLITLLYVAWVAYTDKVRFSTEDWGPDWLVIWIHKLNIAFLRHVVNSPTCVCMCMCALCVFYSCVGIWAGASVCIWLYIIYMRSEQNL